MGAETVGAWDRAASSAKTWLFDYGDLTPFEQAGMKRIMPFYTYTRKVLPRVFEAMVRDPRASRSSRRARTSLESSGPDLSGIPVPGTCRGCRAHSGRTCRGCPSTRS